MSDEFRERFEKIETRLTALERFMTTIIALGSGAAALLTYFGEVIRKKLGW